MANVETTRSVAPSRNGKKLVVRGHSKGHLPGVATPAWLRSSRVFAPENSRSSYVTGSRGRCYGEVTMREDSCRLSDATSDKYQCTLLFPTDSPSRHQWNSCSRCSRFVCGGFVRRARNENSIGAVSFS